MRDTVAAYRAAGAEVMVPYFLGLLAEAHGKAGEIQEGMNVLAEAQAIVDRGRESWWESELYRLKGELILMQSADKGTSAEHYKSAEECFYQALNLASRQRARSLELRAAMSLSRLRREHDKKADVNRILADIYNWFTEGFDTADLKDAKALLDELGA
jgi:predicted ATPase